MIMVTLVVSFILVISFAFNIKQKFDNDALNTELKTALVKYNLVLTYLESITKKDKKEK
jgi:hypothetical protein